MKRILTILCALAAVMAGSIPALAAEAAGPGRSASYYPIQVEEYLENGQPRIRKVYQLSLSDDPSGIPTEDFERDGRLYYLLDMIRKHEVGVDTKEHVETVAAASETDDLEKILPGLAAELEVTTEDGYTGVLKLDHTTVKAAADGYASASRAVSASRSYPNLSDADLSLIPKTIEENGKTLTLEDVRWTSAEQADGDGSIVTRYTAAARYTGSSSYQYATGYTVTADYGGEVVKTECSVVTYTAIFGSMELPRETEPPADQAEEPEEEIKPAEPTEQPEQEGPAEQMEQTEQTASSGLKKPLLIGGIGLAAAAAGIFVFRKLRERRR